MTWLQYCIDCPRIILPTSEWRELPEAQQRLYSPSTSGRCRSCYQKHRRQEARRLRRKGRTITREKTFCGCGCWIFADENCPACTYQLIGEKTA